MTKRVCIFIDGSNFYHSLRDFSNRKVNFQNFVSLLVGTSGTQTLIRTYYYNATRIKEDNSQQYEAQQRFFDALRRLPYFDLRLGRLVRKGPSTVIEKGIDVRIAVDMLQMAYKNIYDVAILVSGDADYVPAIEAVKDVGKHVKLACMKKSRSIALANSVDQVIDLDSCIERCWA